MSRPAPLAAGVKRVVLVLASVGPVGHAAAQQATNVPAALQPGEGSFIYRPLASYFRLDGEGANGDVDMVIQSHALAYGLTPEFTAVAEVPLVYVNTPGTEDVGVGDIDLTLQWRWFADDPAPLQTRRVVLIGGVEVPSFDDGFSSDSLDPFFGVSATLIHRRHAVNAAAVWQFNTGGGGDGPTLGFSESDAEALAVDAAYLYRIDPVSFAEGGLTSTFFQAQFLARYETHGDTQLIFAPGIIHNGLTWAVEAVVQVPLAQDLDQRAELDVGFTAGIRYLF